METMAYMAYMDGVTTNYVRQNLLETSRRTSLNAGS